MGMMTPGQVARMAGVNSETLRYYERRGLLEEPVRRESGHRRFAEETVHRIRFIKRAQVLGFTLEEIRDLLGFRENLTEGCKETRFRAESKIADIQTRIADLRRIERALGILVDECHMKNEETPCPILQSLDDHLEA